MNAQRPIDIPAAMPRTVEARARSRDISDDMALLRAAVELTRDISVARPDIYWPDMLLSTGLGYAALAGAVLFESIPLAVASGVVAALAFYRALLFVHELTHIHRDALPGFRLVWNILIGVPILVPSLMYENVHTLHHARTRYGTAEDPEYLPLALMKPWTLPVFVFISLVAPIGVIIRCAILTPLGVLFPSLRRFVWERFSSLAINPAFRRRPPEGEFRRQVFWQEMGASLWAMVLIASPLFLGWKPLLVALAVFSLTGLLNQLRTLVAHLWENDGEPMTVTAQYLDSVNVPPPSLLAELWAPVGLRYHATHHLLPSLPYHSLGEAHRRISAEFGAGSTFARANYSGMFQLLARIARSTMRTR